MSPLCRDARRKGSFSRAKQVASKGVASVVVRVVCLGRAFWGQFARERNRAQLESLPKFRFLDGIEFVFYDAAMDSP